MTCEACKKRVKTWEGDDPKCAFEDGVFSIDNWNCATVSLVRSIIDGERDDLSDIVDYRYCGDQNYATVKVDEFDVDAYALWVTWYKRRGRTERMVLLDDQREPRPPTEAECLKIAMAAPSAFSAQSK